MPTIFDSVISSTAYQSAKNQLIGALQDHLITITKPKPAASELKKAYEQLIEKVGNLRGRELFFKYIGSGAGNGALVELADGSVKYDLITGIGVNFFGYGNLELLKAQLDSIWCNVMQGNLSPNREYGALMEELLSCVSKKSKLKHVWLSTCGATANENALKIIRQKRYPATKVMTFKDGFAGRTTALQEITDNPKYREGQPTYGEVFYLPFFNPYIKTLASEQAKKVITIMQEELKKSPGRYACLEFETVQGEGGFNAAPREFFIPIIQEAKKAGLAIWIDEIQTFGRTGEIFCYQRLGLDEYVDVVTAAKMLQCGALLYTSECNPKAGLVSGTFAGSSSGLSAGRWVLKTLKEKISGPTGRVSQLEKITQEEFQRISQGAFGKHLSNPTSVGGMVAFTLYQGTLEQTKKFLYKLWDLGAIAFYCGHDPYRIRMLPPFGVISDQQWYEVFQMIEKAIGQTAEELKL